MFDSIVKSHHASIWPDKGFYCKRSPLVSSPPQLPSGDASLRVTVPTLITRPCWPAKVHNRMNEHGEDCCVPTVFVLCDLVLVPLLLAHGSWVVVDPDDTAKGTEVK